MTNIIILINSENYSYHTAVSNMILSALRKDIITISIVDINFYQYDHECLAELSKRFPDILITLDLAGFRFRTQSAENALNMLPCKNLNIIWGNKPEYATLLNKKISLSMLFYDATGTDNHLPSLYPNLLYYKTGEGYHISTTTLSKTDTLCFQNIWNDFLKETLLNI